MIKEEPRPTPETTAVCQKAILDSLCCPSSYEWLFFDETDHADHLGRTKKHPREWPELTEDS